MAERPEDLNLPNTVVARIIKDAIPDGVNVSKEARLAISKAASVFVLYATSCANNFAMKGKRKTISAQDVVAAMEDMEFEQFVEPLNQCLEAFRRNQQEKKTAASDKRKKEKEQVVEEVVPVEDVDSSAEEENQQGAQAEDEVIAIIDDAASDDIEEIPD